MPKKRKRKNKLQKGRVASFIVLCLLISGGFLYGIQKYNNPEIYGTWISLQTNKSVTFKRDGEVILNNGEKATFEITSPNSRMSYTINGKYFEMNYALDGRILSWGINTENIEVFERK